MFSHLTSLAKPPKYTKSSSSNSHNLPLDNHLTTNSQSSSADEDSLCKGGNAESHFNSELETLRQHHNTEEEISTYYSGRLRANSAQTMNSLRTSSTHTTNTNSATSPGLFQQGHKQFIQNTQSRPIASQDSTTNFTHKSATQSSIPTSAQSTSKILRPSSQGGFKTPPRGPFRTLSNASFSMRRDSSLQQPQMELEWQQQQQKHCRAHTDQISPGQQQQLEIITSFTSAPKRHNSSRNPNLPARSTSQNGSRPPTFVDTCPRSQRRLSFIPRPALTPLKLANQSFEKNTQEFNNTCQLASHSRSHGFSIIGDSHNTLPSKNSKRYSTQSQLQKRWSIVETHAGRRQASSIATGTRPNIAGSTNSMTRVPPTSSQAAPKSRRSIKQQPASSGSKPSRQLSTPNKSQGPQVRPDPLSMAVTTQAPVGFKYNPTVLDEDTYASQPPEIPIRKESPEELIHYLERLIGYDELRLLTHVDKLLHHCMHTYVESNIVKQAPQHTTHLNRRSIGNGILGRLGWKPRQGSSTPESPSKSKSIHRAEISHEDRRATFGLLGGNTTRPTKYGIFGRPLEESDPFSCVTVIGGHKHLIPTVIFALVEEIYARGMETPGFMRIAGKAERIDALAESFDHAPLYPDGIALGSEDIHVLCSLFKRYLRALPEPLMSRELFHILWSFCVRERKSTNAGHFKITIAAAQCLLRLMPPRSFSLLIYVVAFLSQIPLFPQCKFSSTGIAKIFGPALFGSRTQRNPTSDERAIQALQWVLENWNALTDGLLNEHFTVRFSESPNAIGSSLRSTCVSEPSSPEPSCQSPMVTPIVDQEGRLPPAQSPAQLPRVGTPDSITSARRLLEWHSNSCLIKSNCSAQHIVDRYEAHEKNLAAVGDQAGHSREGTSDSQEEIELRPRLPRSTPRSPIIEALSNITEDSNETQMTSNTGDGHQHPERTNMDFMTANQQVLITSDEKRPLNAHPGLIEREEKRTTNLPRQSVISLNEPIVATMGLAKQIIDELKEPECDSDNHIRKSLSAISICPSLKSLDSLEVINLITQGRQLQEALTQERLCDCHTFQRNQAERMLKQSIELIQTHQDLLSQMKSQLTELLNMDGQSL